MMKIVIATDSFKGCLSSAEAERAISEAVKSIMPEAETVCIPVSDGGDGMLDAFTGALGAKTETVSVHDPLMRRVTAKYGICDDGTAIIEVAEACGLVLMSKEELNPMRATSYGVGELVAAAALRGCRRFIVGLGGSGTSDAGIGMLRALIDTLAPKGGHIDDVLSGIIGRCRFTLACDVNNPLCGPDGAASVFGPQKGATPEMVKQLDKRAEKFADMSARHFGFDLSRCPGAGAAGGLGYAFMQYLKAEMRPGAELMLDICGFDSIIDGASCVITGEGRADRQTLMGKMPERIMRRAGKKGIPVWLIAGKAEDAERLKEAGFSRVESITPDSMDAEYAMMPDVARENISATIKRIKDYLLTL